MIWCIFMSRKDKMSFICKLNTLICKLKIELKLQVSILTILPLFSLFVLGFSRAFLIKSLPAARKGMKRQKRDSRACLLANLKT